MMLVAKSFAAIVAIAAAVTVSPVAEAGSPPDSTLVELRPAARCTEAVFITGRGGDLVAPTLGLYRVPNTGAAQVVAGLRARGALRFSGPNRIAGSLAIQDFSDPLVPAQWWRAAVGIDALTPPGPGKAVTIVDAGIDVHHPEFVGRADTVILNP